MIVAGSGWMMEIAVHDDLHHPLRARVSPMRVARIAEQEAWSLECLALWREECRRGYVAYSGGKDSAVLLHLANRQHSTEAVTFADREGTHPAVGPLLTWWTAQGVAVHRHVWGSVIETHRRTGRAMMDLDALTRWARAEGYDGCARGLRAEESRGRRMHAVTRHPVRQWDVGFWETDPLLWWTAEDIWAYHAMHRLPYAATYDREDGTPRSRRRVGSMWGLVGAELGRLAELKRWDRPAFQRLVEAMPEATRHA